VRDKHHRTSAGADVPHQRLRVVIGKSRRENDLACGVAQLHPAEPPETPRNHRLRRGDGESRCERFSVSSDGATTVTDSTWPSSQWGHGAVSPV
jgi:hypothetical protein